MLQKVEIVICKKLTRIDGNNGYTYGQVHILFSFLPRSSGYSIARHTVYFFDDGGTARRAESINNRKLIERHYASNCSMLQWFNITHIQRLCV